VCFVWQEEMLVTVIRISSDEIQSRPIYSSSSKANYQHAKFNVACCRLMNSNTIHRVCCVSAITDIAISQRDVLGETSPRLLTVLSFHASYALV
jgi:hypothetical protein